MLICCVQIKYLHVTITCRYAGVPVAESRAQENDLGAIGVAPTTGIWSTESAELALTGKRAIHHWNTTKRPVQMLRTMSFTSKFNAAQLLMGQ